MNEKMTAILHTRGKTVEQITKRYKGISEKDAKNFVEFYDAMDGIQCLVGKSHIWLDGEMRADENEYIYFGAVDTENALKEKEAMYISEQDTMMGTYRNRREDFDRAWESGEWEPPGLLVFDAEDVELKKEETP